MQFLASSLALSFPVMLRMLPIYIMTGVVLFGGVYALIDYPGYLIFVAAVVTFPLLAFLFICAIRAGLVHRRHSRGPELAKLVRKSLLVGLIQAGLWLFYMALSIGAVAMVLRPKSLSEWRDLGTAMEDGRAAGQTDFAILWGASPTMVYALIGAFVIYLAIYVALSVPIAAHSASAAVNGPRHEFFYGVGKKFIPLSIVGLLTLVASYLLPGLLAQITLGASPIDYEKAMELGLTRAELLPIAAFLGGNALLTVWLTSWYGAACAVAYVDVRDHIEEEHQIAMGAIRASAGPQTDLNAMMRERTERMRAAAPVVVATGGGVFADIDEGPDDTDEADDGGLFLDEAAAEQPQAEEPFTAQAALSPEEIEQRFQNKFGNDTGSALRGDLSTALREAAEMEKPPAGSEELDPVDPADLIPADGTVPLDAEQVPAVEPDLHEAVPESDDTPEWLRKYMGNDADKTIFGNDDK